MRNNNNDFFEIRLSVSAGATQLKLAYILYRKNITYQIKLYILVDKVYFYIISVDDFTIVKAVWLSIMSIAYERAHCDRAVAFILSLQRLKIKEPI